MASDNRARSLIDLLAGIAMIVTAFVVVWATVRQSPSPAPPPPPGGSTTEVPEAVPVELQPLSNAVGMGSDTARIGIIEYADFECSACAAFARKTHPQLVSTFVDTGRVRFFFRHFPLPSHQFARPTAIGALCAGQQGKFWPFYEHVYRLQPRLDEPGLKAIARKVAVDTSAWSRCIASERAADVVDADFELGRGLDVRGTPTFLIGRLTGDGRLQATGRLYGAQPFEAFKKAIQEAEVGFLGK